jgi:hypothetical protein
VCGYDDDGVVVWFMVFLSLVMVMFLSLVSVAPATLSA